MVKLFKALLLVTLLGLWSLPAFSTSVNVMGPLWLDTQAQWRDFKNDLQTAKKMGIEAVTVDVWWGAVENEGDQMFDWSYYDNIFSAITSAGLQIIPIMSFHQCGGNVGDSCDVPIPNWIWQHYTNENTGQSEHLKAQTLKPTDLMYKSEQGNYSNEYVSLWADNLVIPQYIEFMSAFESHYAHMAVNFDELNISMGPAGELRYPSYNSHDTNTGYPTRGAFQSFGLLAISDFQQSILSKYQSLSNINKAWQTSYTALEQIELPKHMDTFVTTGQHLNSTYGLDILDWYHQSLMKHGDRLITAAQRGFSKAFKNIDLGYKVPGIHWLMAAPSHLARAAELSAGVISAEFRSKLNNKGVGHGYKAAIGLAAKHSTTERQVILHFTCLEMSDNPVSHSFSLAKTLVSWVGKEAKRQGVTVKGENALAAGTSSQTGWNNITDALMNDGYGGITILRLNDVVNGLANTQYPKLINKLND
ncbi:family 14 glycosylhydrolase [Psychrosphaera sp. 1_MG-2023]|uniref:family 14 glycosylhydrolase n=1 Tax=Psychrosphaera sp. 1_MG-2023 TaxID=3062643 RepID=UPI0026E20EAF|nr:family 14 glycosylhydrolase [Psychrosphaera sp. 1_MG-2023]MDO6720867.1 family 14 glycosylhydrolase [Psychrosphaera sp. 1_MG-2023]